MPDVTLTQAIISRATSVVLARAEDGVQSSPTSTPKPACGSGSKEQAYNTPIHVFALFLILVLSILACSFPIAAKRFPRLPVPHRALFLSRHFGTGVLLATAFVHLLPTAYTSLTDPCLPAFWNESYPAMAGFIAMVSMFVVVGIEMFFATKGAGHSHAVAFVERRDGERRSMDERGNEYGDEAVPMHLRAGPSRGSPGWESPREENTEEGRRLVGVDADDDDKSPFADVPGSDVDDLDIDLDELAREGGSNGFVALGSDGKVTRLDAVERSSHGDQGHRHGHEHGAQGHGQGHSHGPSFLTEEQQQQKALLQCLLLEAGILFHSIFIGMAVSVATGTAFVVLLIAISFHQTFEGLALGSRIAGITAFSRHSVKPWLMALAYGTTTPLGQAIGLVVHNLYDPASQTGLLMVGVMNAISSGLLLFAGLVELLAEDFLSDSSYETLRGQRRLEACGAVVAGAMLMALVGAWA